MALKMSVDVKITFTFLKILRLPKSNNPQVADPISKEYFILATKVLPYSVKYSCNGQMRYLQKPYASFQNKREGDKQDFYYNSKINVPKPWPQLIKPQLEH